VFAPPNEVFAHHNDVFAPLGVIKDVNDFPQVTK
jgi:hypothetical protein